MLDLKIAMRQSNKNALEFIQKHAKRAEYFAGLLNYCKGLGILEHSDKSEEEKFDVAMLVWVVYQNCALFEFESVKSILMEMGFTEQKLRWLIEIKEIENCIHHIVQESPFLIFTENAFTHIKWYMDAKIWNEVLQHFGYTNKLGRRSINLAEKSIRKYFDGSYKRKDPDSEFVREMDQVFAKLHEIGKEQKFATFTKMAAGKLEKICIHPIFHKFMIQNPLEETGGINEKYRAFYPLLKLILRDQQLYSEEEYQQMYDAGVQTLTWSKYQVIKVKNFLR